MQGNLNSVASSSSLHLFPTEISLQAKGINSRELFPRQGFIANISASTCCNALQRWCRLLTCKASCFELRASMQNSIFTYCPCNTWPWPRCRGSWKRIDFRLDCDGVLFDIKIESKWTGCTIRECPAMNKSFIEIPHDDHKELRNLFVNSFL